MSLKKSIVQLITIMLIFISLCLTMVLVKLSDLQIIDAKISSIRDRQIVIQDYVENILQLQKKTNCNVVEVVKGRIKNGVNIAYAMQGWPDGRYVVCNTDSKGE